MAWFKRDTDVGQRNDVALQAVTLIHRTSKAPRMGGKRLDAFDLVFLDCTLTLLAEDTSQSKAFANLLRQLVPPPLTEDGLLDSSGARLCFVSCAECRAKHARRVRDVESGGGDEALCTECGAVLPQSAEAPRQSCDAIFDEDEDEEVESGRLSSRLQLLLSEQGETAAVEAAHSPRAGEDAAEVDTEVEAEGEGVKVDAGKHTHT